jgi:2'-5' RNA ligase
VDTALVVPIPAAHDLIDAWRARTVPAVNLPAHVTLVYPFVMPEKIDADLVERLRAVVAQRRSFPFTLGSCVRDERGIVLPAEPAGQFVTLAEALARCSVTAKPYPADAPAKGPHAVAAMGDGAVLDVAEREIAAGLPIVTRATEVRLLEQVAFPPRGWSVLARFQLD